MQKHKLRSRMAGAATIGVVAMAASLVLGAGVASAAGPPDPAGGAIPVAPHFYNGNVESIRNSGSDTTFFMMQKISDLYTGAGLYGCTLNSAAADPLFNSSDPASATTNFSYFCKSGSNISTTDTADNWDRTEVLVGVDNVGSGAGQNQLCGSATPLPVDFSRSSKPKGSACSTLKQAGYAKDGVPVIDYPVNPSTYGTSTISPYNAINGGSVGPATAGWLPGDPVGGPYTGTALGDISNVDGTGPGGATSTAYRLWCDNNSATNIHDWGQLTNLGPNLVMANVSTTSTSPTITVTGSFFGSIAATDGVTGPGIPAGTTVLSVAGGSITLSHNATATSSVASLVFATGTTLVEGQGAPVGVPVRIQGINPQSGTVATFASFANSGVGSGGGCASDLETNAGNDPNPATAPTPNSPHVALENNSDQLDQFAAGDFPSPDYVDQAIEVSTSLYIESNGVFNTNPYAAAATIHGTSYAGNKLTENGGNGTSTPELLGNTYPTARTLFNIYRTDQVRASTGGFINWTCDGNANFQKGLDNTTGKSFDSELGTTIGTTYGFPRLTDESTPAAVGDTPADGVSAPNNSCAASYTVNTTSGSTSITINGGGNFAPDIPNAGGLPSPFNNVGVSGAGIPAGDYVASGGGTATLTLHVAATATTGGGGATVVLAGVPNVTSVTAPQT